jgi:hypothetical protein
MSGARMPIIDGSLFPLPKYALARCLPSFIPNPFFSLGGGGVLLDHQVLPLLSYAARSVQRVKNYYFDHQYLKKIVDMMCGID